MLAPTDDGVVQGPMHATGMKNTPDAMHLPATTACHCCNQHRQQQGFDRRPQHQQCTTTAPTPIQYKLLLSVVQRILLQLLLLMLLVRCHSSKQLQTIMHAEYDRQHVINPTPHKHTITKCITPPLPGTAAATHKSACNRCAYNKMLLMSALQAPQVPHHHTPPPHLAVTAGAQTSQTYNSQTPRGIKHPPKHVDHHPTQHLSCTSCYKTHPPTPGPPTVLRRPPRTIVRITAAARDAPQQPATKPTPSICPTPPLPLPSRPHSNGPVAGCKQTGPQPCPAPYPAPNPAVPNPAPHQT
jgi:hypothetical protein